MRYKRKTVLTLRDTTYVNVFEERYIASRGLSTRPGLLRPHLAILYEGTFAFSFNVLGGKNTNESYYAVWRDRNRSQDSYSVHGNREFAFEPTYLVSDIFTIVSP